MSTFPAKYEGTCRNPLCRRKINVDDMITVENGYVTHEECSEAVEEKERKEAKVEICQRCFLTRPCEHDDGLR